MDIPGLGGFRCVEKGVRFLGPLFPKNVALVPQKYWSWILDGFRHLAPTWQKCDEKGLGNRGSGSLGYETVESGMRWAGG